MIHIIIGTRPEIIKMSPVIKELEKKGEEFKIIHTGQHYSYNMDKIFFEELELPDPDYNLEVWKNSKTQGEQTGNMIIKIEKILEKEKKGPVLVEGDTNSVLSGAITAIKLHYPVAHLEAGLRSKDYRMPEEYNRIIVDHCSDFLFPPTKKAVDNLIEEGISKEKIFLVGNTIVDATLQNIEIANKRTKFLENIPNEYILLTMHRQENVDNKNELKNILEGIQRVMKETNISIVYPIHPRTKKRILEFNLEKMIEGINVINPVGYLEFLTLEKNAKLIITDSGGVQEEACILKVPCVTIRKSTERPETVEVGANVVSGTEPSNIVRDVNKMIEREKDWKNPFGDGTTSKKIVNILQQSGLT